MATIHLEEISTQYKSFVSDQVLTAEQLNGVVNYFEDQNRLTRICLNGAGIVCGFWVSYVSKESITVSMGCGVTTDADLIKFEGKTYKYYKTFKDENADYSRFDGLTLYELIETKDASKLKAGKLSELTDLDSMVALLYLENYSEKKTPCTSMDCDNQGQTEYANLKILLLSKTDTDKLCASKVDPLFAAHNNKTELINLPEINVERIILRNQYVIQATSKKVVSNKSNTTNYKVLKESYRKAIVDSGAVNNLKTAISSLFNNFGDLLGSATLNINADQIIELLDKHLDIKAKRVPFDFQYRYDLLKDLVATYDEIKNLLFDLRVACCPDVTSFPKHLLLGELVKTEKYFIYRHQFYPSPILANGADKWEEIRTLILRFYLLLKEYNIIEPSEAEIKIIPSNYYSYKLSERTVPYYFKTSQSLLANWNYDKTKRYEALQNLRYRVSAQDSETIKKPLKYDLKGKDFFRIEGHLGKSYKYVLQELNRIKAESAVPVDFKALSIGLDSTAINIDDYTCYFEDLQVLMKAWQAEQECILSEVSGFFSAFSTKEAGVNVKEKELDKSKYIGRIKPEDKAGSDIKETGVPGGNISTFAHESRSLTNDYNLIEVPKSGSEKLDFYTGNLMDIPVVTRSQIIKDNLSSEENTLGRIMEVAFTQNKNGSVNDIVTTARNLIQPMMETDEWKTDENKKTKALVIDQSIELLAQSHFVSQKLPGSLLSLNETAVGVYRESLTDLCKKVKKLKASYPVSELSTKAKAYYSLLTNQLSNICCSAKKLELLYAEINTRKERILLENQLSKFVEHCNSLDHYAGAKAGWTFVVVYLSKALSLSSKKEKVDETVIGTPGLDYGINEGIRETKEDFSDKELQVSANTVIADFAFPFICCSNCHPINFIIQETPVYLHFSKDTYCIGKETDPIDVDVSPLDGEIKPEIPGLTIKDGKLEIDAVAFPAEKIGQPIEFIVNGKVTDAILTVYNLPVVDFTYVYSEDDPSVVSFTPSGDLNKLMFSWDFGDGGTSTEPYPVHKYAVPMGEEKTFDVSLTVKVKDRDCQNTVTKQVRFQPENIKIALKEKNYCSNTDTEFNFDITPVGAKPVIVGSSGVIAKDDGTFVFNPLKATPGKVTFKVNGKASDLQVTVHEAPFVEFGHKLADNILVLSISTTTPGEYTWIIDGNEKDGAINEPLRIPMQDGIGVITVQLRLKTKYCTVETEPKVIPIEYINPVQPCIDQITELVTTDLVAVKKLSRIFKVGSNIRTTIYTPTKDEFTYASSHPDLFLAGEENGKLAAFSDVYNKTCLYTVEFYGNNNTLSNALLSLQRLQLKLICHVLKCQSNDKIDQSLDDLTKVFKNVISGLRFFQDLDITFDADQEIQKYFKELRPLFVNNSNLKRNFEKIISLIK